MEFGPRARFSKAPESFRAGKAIFRSSVSKNREVYKLVYVNKTALYSQGSRFCNSFTGPKSFRGFRETAPWLEERTRKKRGNLQILVVKI